MKLLFRVYISSSACTVCGSGYSMQFELHSPEFECIYHVSRYANGCQTLASLERGIKT